MRTNVAVMEAAMKPFVCAIAFSALLLLVAAENTPVRGDCASDPQSAVADLKKLGARVTSDNEGKPTEVFLRI